VGECAVHRGIAYGLVAPLFEQARVAANHLAELGVSRYQGSLTPTRPRGHGHRAVFGRQLHRRADSEELVLQDPGPACTRSW
jgi:nitrite reductase (NADH) large subunit